MSSEQRCTHIFGYFSIHSQTSKIDQVKRKLSHVDCLLVTLVLVCDPIRPWLDKPCAGKNILGKFLKLMVKWRVK